MMDLLKKHRRFKLLILLLFMSFSCFSLSLFRVYFTGSGLFLFLNWNLFLAFIPWLLTSILLIKPKLQKKKKILFAVLFIWMLFFPNSLYILTDLFHLRLQSLMPIWFDMVLILSFAWTGLILGFISLLDIEKILANYISLKFIQFGSSLLLFITSFGIYLGRYLRWNSWDIFSSSNALLYDINIRISKPFDHLGTWGMTILLGLLLNMFYWSFKFLKTSA